MDTQEAYKKYQPQLFTYAYQLVGSVMEAEDIVQEVFINFLQLKQLEINNLKSYLYKMVTNLCIDYMRSARKQREIYRGPWLPEPLVQEENASIDPVEKYITKTDLSTAFLFLLEKLTINERCVFILKEVLQYSYDEISPLLEKSAVNCRQIYRRAKQKLDKNTAYSKSERRTEEQTMLVTRFLQAIANGDTNELLILMAKDAILYSDGGGKILSAIKPIFGPDRVARFIFGIAKKQTGDIFFKTAQINGNPGFLVFIHNRINNVVSFQFVNGKIQNIFNVINPDKLQHLGKIT